MPPLPATEIGCADGSRRGGLGGTFDIGCRSPGKPSWRNDMADNSNNGGNNGLYFIVGGLVVAVAVGGFLLSGGHLSRHGGGTSSSATVTAPAATSGSTMTRQTERTVTEPSG